MHARASHISLQIHTHSRTPACSPLNATHSRSQPYISPHPPSSPASSHRHRLSPHRLPQPPPPRVCQVHSQQQRHYTLKIIHQTCLSAASLAASFSAAARAAASRPKRACGSGQWLLRSPRLQVSCSTTCRRSSSRCSGTGIQCGTCLRWCRRRMPWRSCWRCSWCRCGGVGVGRWGSVCVTLEQSGAHCSVDVSFACLLLPLCSLH